MREFTFGRTMIAPSIWAAPVIIFFMSVRVVQYPCPDEDETLEEIRAISMSWTVNVSVMAIRRLVLDVSGVDRDSTGLLLRGPVNLGVISEFGTSVGGEHFGNSSCQCCFAVVNVTCTERVGQVRTGGQGGV